MINKTLSNELISFIHVSDAYLEVFDFKDRDRPSFYWFTDRYFDHFLGWDRFAATKYLYFFLKRPVEDKIEFRSRNGDFGFDGLYRKYLEYKRWVDKKELGMVVKPAYEEPAMINSSSRIVPDLISEFDAERKDFVVKYPEDHAGQYLDIFYPSGLSRSFLDTKLIEIFPQLSETLPFCGGLEVDGMFHYSGWKQMQL